MALHNKFVIDLGFSIDCWLLFVVLAFHNLRCSWCIRNNHPLSQNHSPLPWRIRMGRSDLRPSRSRSWKTPQPQTPPSKVMPNPPEPTALPPHQWCNLYPIKMMGSGKSSINDALDWRMRNYNFLDTGVILKRGTRMSTPQIFRTEGEDALCDAGAQVLDSVHSHVVSAARPMRNARPLKLEKGGGNGLRWDEGWCDGIGWSASMDGRRQWVWLRGGRLVATATARPSFIV